MAAEEPRLVLRRTEDDVRAMKRFIEFITNELGEGDRLNDSRDAYDYWRKREYTGNAVIFTRNPNPTDLCVVTARPIQL